MVTTVIHRLPHFPALTARVVAGVDVLPHVDVDVDLSLVVPCWYAQGAFTGAARPDTPAPCPLPAHWLVVWHHLGGGVCGNNPCCDQHRDRIARARAVGVGFQCNYHGLVITPRILPL